MNETPPPVTGGKTAWTERVVKPTLARHAERREHFTTTSAIEVQRLYTPEDVRAWTTTATSAYPGEFPFTRGVQPDDVPRPLLDDAPVRGLRHGRGDESRATSYLLDAGQTGLSVAFDLPTQMGYDSDHRVARAKSDESAWRSTRSTTCARCSDGIPLDKVSTSMTINATASILLALYIAVAR